MPAAPEPSRAPLGRITALRISKRSAARGNISRGQRVHGKTEGGRAMKRRALVVCVLAVAVLVAMPMPAAVAAKPFREQIRGVDRESFEFVIPADVACPFAIGVQ